MTEAERGLAVDSRQFTDNRARTENRENALGAGRPDDADLQQSLLDVVAAVAGIAGQEQHLVRREFDRLGVIEQLRRQDVPGTTENRLAGADAAFVGGVLAMIRRRVTTGWDDSAKAQRKA